MVNKYIDLQKTIKTNLFTLADVKKHFPKEKFKDINIQLSRFKKRKLINVFKRGIYCFNLNKVNELELANKLYQPSYISLETALNYYGIMPDITQSITSINPIASKEFKTKYGFFTYHKRKQTLARDIYDIVFLIAQGAKLDQKFIKKIK
jgi:predicted transcriptional regulator of viral defense system